MRKILTKLTMTFIGLMLICTNAIFSQNQSSLKWTFQTGDGIDSSPAIADDGTIYMASDDHNLYAINPDHTLKWIFETGHKALSSPAISAAVIYDGNLFTIKGSNSVLAPSARPKFRGNSRNNGRRIEKKEGEPHITPAKELPTKFSLS